MAFEPSQIRRQIEAINDHPAFMASQRSRGLLSYLVEETLAGRGERLKGYSIATEYLGRGADFDPLIDPIVRIEVGKLRRALEGYYLGAGREDALRVEIHKGNYQPQFVDNAIPAPADVPAETPPALAAPLLGCASLVIRAAADDENALARDFATGLAQQLATLLDRLDDVYVLATDALEASSVRFVLQVGVRSSGERLRVAVKLDDRLRGTQVWAETFTEVADDVFALEDALARRIANRIADPNAGEMFQALRNAASDTAALSPDELVARFNVGHLQRLGDAAWLREMRTALERVIAANPDFAAARAALSKAIHDEFVIGEASRDEMRESFDQACHALRLEPESQHALAALTNACIALGDHDRAVEAIERGLALNRTGHSARAIAAVKFIMLGDAERADALLAQHEGFGPGEPPISVVGRALLAWLRGEHEQALQAVSQNLMGNTFWGGLVRTVSLAETGAVDEARRALDALRKENPAFTRDPKRFLSISFSRRDWQEKLLGALAKAGLEEAA